MITIEDIAGVRRWVAGRRAQGRRVSFVPTMGALHAGHGACVKVANSEPQSDTVVSIFVNPTQFGPSEDLDRYPRPIERDGELLQQWGAGALFHPTAAEMYPREPATWVDVSGLDNALCGASRPGHFRGVATVVAKLFNIVQPDVAVFGQKDAQQALILRQMVAELHLPVTLRLCPIVREDDGLALSSRNAYLDTDERQRARSLAAGLAAAAESLGDRPSGDRAAWAARAQTTATRVVAAGADHLEYCEFRRVDDLSLWDGSDGRVILAVAAHVGSTRLIDNAVFDVTDKAVTPMETMF